MEERQSWKGKKCSLHKKHGERKVIIFVREGEKKGWEGGVKAISDWLEGV